MEVVNLISTYMINSCKHSERRGACMGRRILGETAVVAILFTFNGLGSGWGRVGGIAYGMR